jgi:hypothetical protein
VHHKSVYVAWWCPGLGLWSCTRSGRPLVCSSHTNDFSVGYSNVCIHVLYICANVMAHLTSGDLGNYYLVDVCGLVSNTFTLKLN